MTPRRRRLIAAAALALVAVWLAIRRHPPAIRRRSNPTRKAPTMSVWDDPELANGGEFYEFNNIGDTASGSIKVVRTHTFDDGKKVPQILMIDDTGEERTLTAGQIRLKAELVELRPEPGDHLRVVLANIEKRSGGKTLKHFDVTVTRGHAPHLAQAAAAAPVTAPAPVAAAPAYVPPPTPPAPAPPAYAPPPAPAYAPPPPPAPAPPVAAPAPTPPAPAGIDPAAAAAALANLTPEQRTALGL